MPNVEEFLLPREYPGEKKCNKKISFKIYYKVVYDSIATELEYSEKSICIRLFH